MSESEPQTAAGLFGSNSDGGMRMWAWLDVMCRGCVHESARLRAAGEGGGNGCRIVGGVLGDPYEHPVPEWVVPDVLPDAMRAELGEGPWPVCQARQERAARSDKGLRRGPRVAEGQGSLFGEAS